MIQVNANANQEETGRQLFLDDPLASTIHCPLFPDPESTLNYSAVSCNQRLTQRINKCDRTGCERYKRHHSKPGAVTKPAVKPKAKKKAKRKRLVAICDDCGKLKKIAARGLCTTCHPYHYRKGTLKNFPKTH